MKSFSQEITSFQILNSIIDQFSHEIFLELPIFIFYFLFCIFFFFSSIVNTKNLNQIFQFYIQFLSGLQWKWGKWKIHLENKSQFSLFYSPFHVIYHPHFINYVSWGFFREQKKEKKSMENCENGKWWKYLHGKQLHDMFLTFFVTLIKWNVIILAYFSVFMV